jgi:hypothetical protein
LCRLPLCLETGGETFGASDWPDNYSFHSALSGGVQPAVYQALAARACGENVSLPQ